MAVKNEVLDFIFRSHNCITVILQHHTKIYKLSYTYLCRKLTSAHYFIFIKIYA